MFRTVETFLKSAIFRRVCPPLFIILEEKTEDERRSATRFRADRRDLAPLK